MTAQRAAQRAAIAPKKAPQAPRTSKYNARPTWYKGERYDSWGEAEYARELDRRQAAGEIRRWRRGTPWVLFGDPDNPHGPDTITLTPDFVVWQLDGRREVHDFKGVITDLFRIKACVFRERYPGVPLLTVDAGGAFTNW